MLENLPRLEFIPVEILVIHEYHDDQRTPPLIESIRQSGVWRNPPIVTPLQDGSGRYMVLDGANRTVALKKMGIQHALVQVVQPDDSGLRLYNWNHVVWGLEQGEFLAGLRQIEGLEIATGKDDRPDLWGDCGLASIQVARGDFFTVCTPARDLVERLKGLHAVVDSYKDRAHIDRTSEWSVVRLKAVYPELSGLVIFPHLEVRQVMQLAGAGYLLPTGITRFTVSPRALHINYPFEELAEEKTLEEKNASLQRFIHDRVKQKGVRYYAEATILFDE
jgi:hypothetical protein